MGFFDSPGKYAAGLCVMGVLFIGLAGHSAKTGRVRGRGYEVSREGSPALFSLLIGMFVVIGFLAFACAAFVLRVRS